MKSDTVVRFYESVEPSLLKYAIVAARYRGKWVFCRHRKRKTWEIPGGHREPGEQIMHAAERELFEETGAVRYTLMPVGVYSVTGSVNGGEEWFGMLYFAEVKEIGPLPPFEMAKLSFEDSLPALENLTYPEIQPELFKQVLRQIKEI